MLKYTYLIFKGNNNYAKQDHIIKRVVFYFIMGLMYLWSVTLYMIFPLYILPVNNQFESKYIQLCMFTASYLYGKMSKIGCLSRKMVYKVFYRFFSSKFKNHIASNLKGFYNESFLQSAFQVVNRVTKPGNKTK